MSTLVESIEKRRKELSGALPDPASLVEDEGPDSLVAKIEARRQALRAPAQPELLKHVHNPFVAAAAPLPMRASEDIPSDDSVPPLAAAAPELSEHSRATLAGLNPQPIQPHPGLYATRIEEPPIVAKPKGGIDRSNGLMAIATGRTEDPGTYGILEETGRGLARGVLGLAGAAMTGGRIVAETIGADRAAESFRERAETARELAEYDYAGSEEHRGKSIFDNPAMMFNPKWLAGSVGEMAPSFMVPLGVATRVGTVVKAGAPAIHAGSAAIKAGKAAAIAGGAVGGLLEGTGTYEELRERGLNHAGATAAAGVMAATTGALNALALGKLLEPGAVAGTGSVVGRVAGRLARAAGKGAWEAGTEIAEEPSEGVIKKLFGGVDPETGEDRYSWADVVEQTKQGLNVGPASFLMGGGGSLMTSPQTTRTTERRTLDGKKKLVEVPLTRSEAKAINDAVSSRPTYKEMFAAEEQAEQKAQETLKQIEAEGGPEAIEALGDQALAVLRNTAKWEALQNVMGRDKFAKAFPLAAGVKKPEDLPNMPDAVNHLKRLKQETDAVEEIVRRVDAGEDVETVKADVINKYLKASSRPQESPEAATETEVPPPVTPAAERVPAPIVKVKKMPASTRWRVDRDEETGELAAIAADGTIGQVFEPGQDAAAQRWVEEHSVKLPARSPEVAAAGAKIEQMEQELRAGPVQAPVVEDPRDVAAREWYEAELAAGRDPKAPTQEAAEPETFSTPEPEVVPEPIAAIEEDLPPRATAEEIAAVPDPVVQELPKAKRNPATNEWNFEADGVVHTIYRDPEDKMWYETPERTHKHFSELFRGFTKDEAIKNQIAAYRRDQAEAAKPAAPKVESKPKRRRLTAAPEVAPVPAEVEAEKPKRGRPKKETPAPKVERDPAALPTEEEVAVVALERYPTESVTHVEARGSIMRGYRDAMAGKDRKSDKPGAYAIGYDMVMRAKAIQNRMAAAEKEVLENGGNEEDVAALQQIIAKAPVAAWKGTDSIITNWFMRGARVGTGRFTFSEHLRDLTLEQVDAISMQVRRALVDESGNDRIAGVVNQLMGTDVQVTGAGLHPLANPSNTVQFVNMPLGENQARAWTQRYMAVRGILMGTESEAAFQLVGNGHGNGDFDGYVITMSLDQFFELSQNVDGGSYDAETGEATFINFRGVPTEEYGFDLNARLERLPGGDIAVAPASFNGEHYGQSDYFVSIGREPETLRTLAGILTDHIAPVVADATGTVTGDGGRIRAVAHGLRTLAKSYEKAPPAGIKRQITLEEANKQLAKTFPHIGKNVGVVERIKILANRLNSLTGELLPFMKKDLKMSDDQVRNWYAAARKDQRAILTLVQPELSEDSSFVMMTAIHAILSNGNEVNTEAELGAHIFEQYLMTGEITYLDPMTANRGTFTGQRGTAKTGESRFAVGEPGFGIGGQDIFFSARWLTHEISLRRLQALVATIGEQEAAKWLRASRPGPGGRTMFNAVELLGPKIGQYFLDRQGIENQDSTIDLWIGRLHDILNGDPEIHEDVTPEQRQVMQGVFREFKYTDSPAAAQAISWYITKYLYRRIGTGEKKNAYATLPSAAADLLAGDRPARPGRLGIPVSVGTPKATDKVIGRPRLGWGMDSKFAKIVKREGWEAAVDDLSLVGLSPRELEDMAAAAIGGSKNAENLVGEAEELHAAEAAIAYGKNSKLPGILTQKLVEWVGEKGSYWLGGLPTTASRLAAIENNLQGRGSLDIIGQTFSSPAELANLLRAFRDPRFEHFHYILLDDNGGIVYHSADTSGTIGSVMVPIDRANRMIDIAKKKGVTRVVIAHNHPSGNSRPSVVDLDVTEALEEEFEAVGLKLEYHLVMDHDEASTIEIDRDAISVRGDNVFVRKIAVEPDQEDDWTIHHLGKDGTREPIRDAHEMAALIRQRPEKGGAYLVYTDTHNRILAVEPHTVDALQGAGLGWLSRQAVALGAHGVMAVTNDAASPGSFRNISANLKEVAKYTDAYILDVIDISPSGDKVRSALSDGLFEQAEKSDSGLTLIAGMEMVAESGTKYNPFASETDPRVEVMRTSEDVVTRVVTALEIGLGNQQYTRAQIQLAVLAAQSPDVLASLQAQAPEGRGTYRTERWLRDIAPVSEPQHMESVISPEQVIAELSRVLHVPILSTGKRWGILRKRGAEGAYKPGTRIIRINNAGDIEAATHEIGHYVHELVYGLTKSRKKLNIKAIDPRHVMELEGLAKSVSSGDLGEGVAEFFRRFVTNPDAAATQAPEYHDFIVAELDAKYPDVLKHLLKARQDFEQWRTATDAARIRARIHSIAEPDAPNPNKSRWDTFVEWVVDDLHYFGKVSEQLVGKDSIAADNPHLMARLLRGSAGPAEYWLKHGSVNWNDRTKRGPGLEEILKPIFETGQRDDFTAYAVARRAAWIIENKGVDVGFDLGTAQRTVQQLENITFMETFDALVRYNRHLLEMLVDSQVISEEDYLRILDSGGIDVYVPFYRVSDKSQRGGMDKSLFLSKNVVKRLRGDTADIIDPIESMIKNTYTFTQAALQQRVGSALIKMAGAEGSGSMLDLIKPAAMRRDVKFSEIWDQINSKMGGVLGDIPEAAAEAIAAIYSPGDFFGTPNVISIIENGERKWFEVIDKDLYKALMGSDDQALGWAVSLLAKPSGWRRTGAVLTPEFILRNPIKDQITAAVNSNYGYVPWWDLWRGMSEILGNTDLYQKWILSGGQYSTLTQMDRVSRRKRLEDLESSGNFVMNVIKHPLSGLQALSALMENGTRMGEFLRAYEVEMSKAAPDEIDALDRAAIAARDVTDYAIHGSRTKAVRALATFWNAGVQGDVRAIKAFKDHPRAATLKALLMITVPSIALALVNADDDEYWEIPQWQRDMFWMFKVPGNAMEFIIPDFLEQTEESGAAGQFLKPFISSKEGVWVRIPKGYGVAQIFGTIPERIIEWAKKNDPEGLKKSLANLIPVNPFASYPVMGGVPDLAFFQPFAENFGNFSRFMKRPIVPEYLEKGSDQFEYNERTSDFAKDLAKAVAKIPGAQDLPGMGTVGLSSPMKIDNLFRSWTAGLGAYALTGYAIATAPLRDKSDQPSKPAKTLADMAVVKAFTARNPGWSGESVARMYERIADLSRYQEDVNRFTREKDMKRVREYKKTHADELAEYVRLKKAADRVRTHRDISERAQISKMSPIQKRDVFEKHGRIATEIAAKALEKSKEKRRRLVPE